MTLWHSLLLPTLDNDIHEVVGVMGPFVNALIRIYLNFTY